MSCRSKCKAYEKYEEIVHAIEMINLWVKYQRI